jgi:hypothetical protein
MKASVELLKIATEIDKIAAHDFFIYGDAADHVERKWGEVKALLEQFDEIISDLDAFNNPGERHRFQQLVQDMDKILEGTVKDLRFMHENS